VTDGPDHNDFVTEWEHWHHDHERQLASPHGFLAISGLHWLGLEPERFDDVPGVWRRDAKGVEVLLGDGEELVVEGSRVTGHYHFNNVDEHGQRASFGDAMVEVAQRDGDFMIRPRHPDHENRTRYVGTPTYPASTEWVARGNIPSLRRTSFRHGWCER